MRTDRRRLIARSLKVLLTAVAAVAAVAVLSPSATPTDYRPRGDPLPMPGEQLATATAEEFAGILVGLEGRPIVVNVWASWCAPCRAEMPLLERAAAEFEGRVTFVGLASKDSRSAAAEFLDDVGVTYPNLFAITGDARRALGLRGSPTTYFFDATGDLREAVTGGVTEQRLAAQLEDLVG